MSINYIVKLANFYGRIAHKHANPTATFLATVTTFHSAINFGSTLLARYVLRFAVKFRYLFLKHRQQGQCAVMTKWRP